MWRNYLTVGLRALLKNRTYAVINIAGLAVGLAACLMILLYVRYETSYEAWLPNADRTFQLQNIVLPTKNGGEEYRLQMSSYVSRRDLVKDFPQIERAVYVHIGGGYILQNGQASSAEVRFVDDNLLQVIELPLVRGNRATALQRPGQLVLSESEARRRFGAENPIGRTLTIVSRNGPRVDYEVTAVFRDIPPNSHMAFNIIARFDPQSAFADNPSFFTSWGTVAGWVYVRLRPGVDAAQINSQLPAWERRNIPVDPTDRSSAGDNQDWRLVNVRDVHLGDAQLASMRPGNDERTVATFVIIAALILGMACVNFTNLATARASQRAREVALRKVLGAKRKQLIAQFLGEGLIVSAISALIALALVELLLPSFNAFLDADIVVPYLGAHGLLLPVLGLVLIVGAAGGLYPALYLSRFQPAQILKANNASDGQGSSRLRNILVVAQFAVSIGLIICTVVVYSQTVYARTLDPGYRRDGLLQIEMNGRERLEQSMDALRREIAAVPGVTAVGRTEIGVATGNNGVASVQLPGQSRPITIGRYVVDPGFFPAMGMRMLAGRNFDEHQARDDGTTPRPVDMDAERALVARGLNVVITESAARRLGYRTPQEAIGKEFTAVLVSHDAGPVPATVIGVVNDARFRSVRDPVQPILFYSRRERFDYFVIRFQGDPSRVREGIEAVWRRIVPDVPFEVKFAEQLVSEQYDREQARAEIFAAFSFLSIVIGCLGLLGLAAFTAERRTREIGIRKVFGARIRDIVRLLAWQFSKPVIIANLIAWPIAWWLMRDWLNDFDARIDLGPAPFLAAGAIALAIAFGTVASHAIRVARANPIIALRYE